MTAFRRLGNYPSDIEETTIRFTLEAGVKPGVGGCHGRGDARQQGGRAGATGAIVKFKALAQTDEPLRHGPDRRDPDAAGDENAMRSVLIQGKMASRNARLQDVARLDALMKIARTPSSVRFKGDGDHIAMRFGGVIEQRVLPYQSIAGRQINMRTRAECG